MTWNQIAAQLTLLPGYLGHHMLLSAAATAAGLVVCLPVAVMVTRVPALQWPVLTFAGVMQTVPGIALLALMVPLLGQIGTLPALIALFVYSMLPILRNTVAGILGVDASLTEAARGMGMTPTQMLFSVELPLALPVIIAGVRTATVWVVGTATLATPVGATSLGNFIFGGLQTQNPAAVLVGCVAAAGLAVILDQLIHLAERAVATRNKRLGMVAATGLMLVTAGGLAPVMPGFAVGQPPVVVGGKTFTEQYILAGLIARTMEEHGIRAETRTGMGSTILFDALANGNIDCYVDYSGTLWANIMKREDHPPRDSVIALLARWLRAERHVHLIGPLGFENTYALAVRRSDAVKRHLHSIQDLAAVAPQLTIGSDYEFFSRPEWNSLRSAYGLNFMDQKVFDPSLMYQAIGGESVDVISAYSTDGRIVEYDLVVLDDPRQALPPYDAVLLLSGDAARRPEIVESMAPLIHSITDVTMREANNLVDVKHRDVPEAVEFLLRMAHSRAGTPTAPGGTQ